MLGVHSDSDTRSTDADHQNRLQGHRGFPVTARAQEYSEPQHRQLQHSANEGWLGKMGQNSSKQRSLGFPWIKMNFVSNSFVASQTWPAWCGHQRKRTCSADTSTGPAGSFSSNSWRGKAQTRIPLCGLKQTPIGNGTHPSRQRKRIPSAMNYQQQEKATGQELSDASSAGC